MSEPLESFITWIFQILSLSTHIQSFPTGTSFKLQLYTCLSPTSGGMKISLLNASLSSFKNPSEHYFISFLLHVFIKVIIQKMNAVICPFILFLWQFTAESSHIGWPSKDLCLLRNLINSIIEVTSIPILSFQLECLLPYLYGSISYAC